MSTGACRCLHTLQLHEVNQINLFRQAPLSNTAYHWHFLFIFTLLWHLKGSGSSNSWEQIHTKLSHQSCTVSIMHIRTGLFYFGAASAKHSYFSWHFLCQKQCLFSGSIWSKASSKPSNGRTPHPSATEGTKQKLPGDVLQQTHNLFLRAGAVNNGSEAHAVLVG